MIGGNEMRMKNEKHAMQNRPTTRQPARDSRFAFFIACFSFFISPTLAQPVIPQPRIHGILPLGARAGQRPVGQQSTPRGTVDRRGMVPETEDRLLSASRLLSPHGTEMRARTPFRARSTRSSSRSRRSQCDRHPGTRHARRRASPRGVRGERATAPRIAPGAAVY